MFVATSCLVMVKCNSGIELSNYSEELVLYNSGKVNIFSSKNALKKGNFSKLCDLTICSPLNKCVFISEIKIR